MEIGVLGFIQRRRGLTCGGDWGFRVYTEGKAVAMWKRLGVQCLYREEGGYHVEEIGVSVFIQRGRGLPCGGDWGFRVYTEGKGVTIWKRLGFQGLYRGEGGCHVAKIGVSGFIQRGRRLPCGGDWGFSVYTEKKGVAMWRRLGFRGLYRGEVGYHVEEIGVSGFIQRGRRLPCGEDWGFRVYTEGKAFAMWWRLGFQCLYREEGGCHVAEIGISGFIQRGSRLPCGRDWGFRVYTEGKAVAMWKRLGVQCLYREEGGYHVEEIGVSVFIQRGRGLPCGGDWGFRVYTEGKGVTMWKILGFQGLYRGEVGYHVEEIGVSGFIQRGRRLPCGEDWGFRVYTEGKAFAMWWRLGFQCLYREEGGCHVAEIGISGFIQRGSRLPCGRDWGFRVYTEGKAVAMWKRLGVQCLYREEGGCHVAEIGVSGFIQRGRGLPCGGDWGFRVYTEGKAVAMWKRLGVQCLYREEGGYHVEEIGVSVFIQRGRGLPCGGDWGFRVYTEGKGVTMWKILGFQGLYRGEVGSHVEEIGVSGFIQRERRLPCGGDWGYSVYTEKKGVAMWRRLGFRGLYRGEVGYHVEEIGVSVFIQRGRGLPCGRDWGFKVYTEGKGVTMWKRLGFQCLYREEGGYHVQEIGVSGFIQRGRGLPCGRDWGFRIYTEGKGVTMWKRLGFQGLYRGEGGYHVEEIEVSRFTQRGRGLPCGRDWGFSVYTEGKGVAM